jgi:hypothetical protein
MDGEARFMGARKTGRTGGWTRIKRKVAKHKEEKFLVVKKELAG